MVCRRGVAAIASENSSALPYGCPAGSIFALSTPLSSYITIVYRYSFSPSVTVIQRDQRLTDQKESKGFQRGFQRLFAVGHDDHRKEDSTEIQPICSASVFP